MDFLTKKPTVTTKGEMSYQSEEAKTTTTTTKKKKEKV
jgi:hypothetical protein